MTHLQTNVSQATNSGHRQALEWWVDPSQPQEQNFTLKGIDVGNGFAFLVLLTSTNTKRVSVLTSWEDVHVVSDYVKF